MKSKRTFYVLHFTKYFLNLHKKYLERATFFTFNIQRQHQSSKPIGRV